MKDDIAKLGLIRSYAPGVVLAAYATFFLAAIGGEITHVDKLIGVGLLSILSVFIYFSYRAFFYDKWITLLQDRSKKNDNNYRTYLRQRFQELKDGEATQVYVILRDKHFKRQVALMKIRADAIHLFYMSSILAVPFYFASLWFPKALTLAWLYAFCSVVPFIVAFRLDASFESQELGHLLELSPEQIQIAVDIVCKKRKPVPSSPPSEGE